MLFLKSLKSNLLLATVATLSLVSHPVLAQVSPQDSSADAGRYNEDLKQKLPMPAVSPQIVVKQMDLIGTPNGADKISFKFDGLRLEGNEVYSASELATVYQDKIGQTITLADLYQIANEIALKYRNDGYILTQVVIPPQTIDKGLPLVKVVEGVVDQVIIQADGQSDAETALIRSYVSQIGNHKALNVRDMERQLLLVNDLPGVDARTVISPSTTKTGAADLLVIVTRDPFEGLVSLDNLGSRYLGPWTLGGNASLNSLLGQNEEISVQAAFAPGTGYELLYGSLSYEQPVGIYGTRLGGLISVTATDPGYDLSSFDVNGRSALYSVYARHPFIRSRNTNLSGRLAFDIRDVKSSNNIENTRYDHIRALRANLKYDFLDTILGGAAVNSINAQVSKGLGIFNASEEGDFTSRPNGDPEFTKMELQLQRLQRVTDDVNVLLTGRGQKANNALLSSEEFGLGGAYTGRGYDPSEITGDDGMSGQIEFQWNNPFTISDAPILEHIQLYSFADAGVVWNEDATTSADKRASLFSTGIGARLDLTHDIKMDLGVAKPMSRDVGTQGDKDPRYYLSINKKF